MFKKSCPATLESFMRVKGKWPKCDRPDGHDGPHQSPSAGYEWQGSSPGKMDFVRPIGSES